jgi:murein DD-endopeptidase MepM/ murein hydrolase activator NlpD
MGAIIENQRIAKRGGYNRNKSSSLRPSNKSAGFNTGFMSQFDQKPARATRTKRKEPDSLKSYSIRTENRSHEKSRAKSGSSRSSGSGSFSGSGGFSGSRGSSRSSGFSFPVPSVATIAVIAGTVLIALTALKWEDLNIITPGNYAFQPGADNGTEIIIKQYAATGISDITGALQILPAIEGATASSAPSAAQVPVTQIPSSTQEPSSAQVPSSTQVPVSAQVPVPAQVSAEAQPQNDLITFTWQQYRVRRGDSVSVIAKKFDVSIGAIIASNDISNARRLQEGAVLRIPNIDGIPYQIKAGDSLSKISASFNVPLEVILDVNDIKSDNIRAGETIFIPGARMNDMDLRMSLGELFMYPIQGRYITSHFGMRKDPISGQLNFHTGIDLRGNTGAAVSASMDGVVSVTSENWLYGKHIIISHANGYKTLYAHLNSFSVKQGDRVARGRKIGEVGNTGYSTGPHLHFGIYDKNGKMVNPVELLN